MSIGSPRRLPESVRVEVIWPTLPRELALSRRMPNHLANQTSPYLLGHAHNPVDWYPWGSEALERAKREDKPIFLSIGYAACHWCHVMERESFEDEAIAKFLNEHFVSIKVDREERPDLDEIYMTATVALSGSGGWPMTVFLTPEQEPFFAGTYYPPTDKYGRPGFPTLLARIAELWTTRREDLVKQASELTLHVRGGYELPPAASIADDAWERAVGTLAQSFDPVWGGFGEAPKFPPTPALLLLFRHHHRHRDELSLRLVTTTLDGMKNGGMYDQLAGGFARYSTDERWLVPHFEKMLYDNAELSRAYLEGFQLTANTEYRRVATETLDYVLREMQGIDGGYFSATDADSEGEEGKFFVWALDEVQSLLERDDAERFAFFYDVTAEGNWEGKNVLSRRRTLEEAAAALGDTPEVLGASLARSRETLYEARKKRVPPLLDDKVIAAWNGLMIGAMAEGFRVLRDRRYLESAERAAAYVWSTLRRPDGGLYRTARHGRAHLDACLEDHAYLADAFVTLYEAGGPLAWLDRALELAERLLAEFGDDGGGAFFATARGHEKLVARPREGHDGALPNANAVAARALARLARHFDRSDLAERATSALDAFGAMVSRAPRVFATTLVAAEFLRDPPVELVFAGRSGAPDREALEAAVASRYLPRRVMAHVEPGEPARTGLPLLAGKTDVSGRAALYVCRNYACERPVLDPAEVIRALG
ncbi:MAG TPA: thioredoxin domain-containing protein [Polyangiaceae bacterium]